jgi:hypothetical protein
MASPCAVVGCGVPPGVSVKRYGSASLTPLMKTLPSWISTVSPPSPMTRLMNGVPSSCAQASGG